MAGNPTHHPVASPFAFAVFLFLIKQESKIAPPVLRTDRALATIAFFSYFDYRCPNGPLAQWPNGPMAR